MPKSSLIVVMLIASFLSFPVMILAPRWIPSLRNEKCPVCEVEDFKPIQIDGQSRGESYYRCASCGATYRNGVLHDRPD